MGVFVRLDRKGGPELSQRLRAELEILRARTGDDSNRHWPAKRRLPPDASDPGDLDTYAQVLREAPLDEWDATQAVVDRNLPSPAPNVQAATGSATRAGRLAHTWSASRIV